MSTNEDSLLRNLRPVPLSMKKGRLVPMVQEVPLWRVDQEVLFHPPRKGIDQ